MDSLLADLAKVEQGQDLLNTRTYVQAMGSVCRNAGHRFGDHVERVMAVVLRLLNTSGRGDPDEELREHCLQVCASCHFTEKKHQAKKSRQSHFLSIFLLNMKYDLTPFA